MSYEPIRIQTQLREKLELGINNPQKTAFSLGAHLDAGVRPPDVYLRMFDAEKSDQSLLNSLRVSDAEELGRFFKFDEDESAQHEVHSGAIKEESDAFVGRLVRTNSQHEKRERRSGKRNGQLFRKLHCTVHTGT